MQLSSAGQEASSHEASQFSWHPRSGSVLTPALSGPCAAAEQSMARGIIDDGFLWNYFRERLRELGDIDGQNVTIESRTADGNPDRLLAAAQELARRPVDVIAVAGSSAAKAAQAATDTVPVVAMVIGDPVAIGLVKDWQRPGGNIIGSTTLSSNLAAKRLQLLNRILPYLSRVAYFWNPENPSSRTYLECLRISAPSIDATTIPIDAHASSEFEGF
jgi:putative ABC transport system substrate-binding protein